MARGLENGTKAVGEIVVECPTKTWQPITETKELKECRSVSNLFTRHLHTAEKDHFAVTLLPVSTRLQRRV
jgi:hypothetical protein